jgi:hypothetical protein
VQAALDVLIRHSDAMDDASARLALLACYAHMDADGPRRDPGSYVRRATLAALRPTLLPADTALLLRAVTTVERLPPAFKDEAILLRCTALVTLNDVDDTLAGYHAARLLFDPETDPMSSEPGLTAARVLANQENLLPLYAYVMRSPGTGQPGDAPLPDVISECLRGLVALPLPLVAGVVAQHGQNPSAAVRAGLCDLLIGHTAGPQGLEYLRTLLGREADLDMLHYVALALLTRRDEALREMVADAAHLEAQPARRAVLEDALAYR